MDSSGLPVEERVHRAVFYPDRSRNLRSLSIANRFPAGVGGSAARRRLAPSVSDWLLLAASITVSLGLAELGLRFFFPLFSSPYAPDDVALVKIVPGAKKAFTRLRVNGGQRIVAQFNSDGFRGEPLRAPDHLERVIVYGDSNVEADFSELPATFPKQLESRLKPDVSSGVEVLNAGVDGYGPDQISVRLAGDLERFKPALVVVVIFADNDFGDLIRNRIYRLDSRGELELNHYRLAPDLRARMERAAYPQGLRRLQLWRYTGRIWGVLRERWSGATAKAQRGFLANYVDSSLALNQQTFRELTSDSSAAGYSADPMFDYYDADIALEPDSPSARYKTALMEKVLIKLRDTAAQAGTGLLLTILPSPVDACDHYDMQVDTSRYPHYDRTRLSRLVEDMAVRNEIPYLNLWYAFRATDANRLYFHGGDNHWNDAGQAEAAQLAGEVIEHRHLLPKP